jgi:membrane protein implicated in regulation of membrane protease activity
MDDPEVWRWIWLVAAFLFAVGEMASAGSFFLLPFAVGAGTASVLAFAEVGLTGQWIAFVGVSIGIFAALRPLARRLDRGEPTAGIGSKRLIGESAIVIEEIPGGHDLGMVRVHREEWRAEAVDGAPVPAGVTVSVLEQRGTRLVVSTGPTDTLPPFPPVAPPTKEA